MKANHIVLAVDDEQENLNLVRRIFKGRYEVRTALNAGEAVAALESVPVDLILCDQRMPGRTGVDLLEEVRERWPGVARILVTAYADMEAAVAAINRGQVRRYISKPWDNDELEAIVEQELRFNDLRSENERLARDLEKRNRELIDANRELESLDRVKSKLLSNVSHELKTPLIAIKGYAEMLTSGRGGEVGNLAREFLAGIQRATDRLENLIGNIIQGARMASDEQTLVLAELDLVVWARAAIRRLRPQAEQKGVVITLEEEGRVVITADATSMDRVFENLLSNAIKFNVRGGEVRVSVMRGSGEAKIEVADTGIGVPEGAGERIFERFYQAVSSDTHKYPGTGIGLAIVKDAVERHGGRIELKTSQGKGSTFRIFLPAAAKLKDDSGEFARFRRWEGHLLLLADPDDSDRETIRATLLGEGFAVLPVLDFDSARAMAQKHAPHAVVYDVRLLPEGLDPPPEGIFPVPSVAMLPERIPDLVKRVLAAGAVGTILKPFRKEEFLFLLEKTVKR